MKQKFSFLAICGAFLLHPLVVIAGILAGVYIGIAHKPLAAAMKKPGAIYLGLLQMCVLPIMIAAVVSSVGNLLRSGKANSYLSRLVMVFVFGMLIVSFLGALTGLVGRPGANLTQDQKALLGREIVEMEIEQSSSALSTSGGMKDGFDFVMEMIPCNVFQAISEGKTLPILFFCVLIGIALGTLTSADRDIVLSFADASYEALLKLLGWMMYGLPFGLMFLFADQISVIGAGIFMALFKLILLMYLICFLLLLIYAVVIWLRCGMPFLQSFMAMKRALLVAVGASSSFAALPFALQALHKDLRFEKETMDLVIPLGINLNPHGNIVCFALMAVFMCQLYDVPLSGLGYLGITFYALLAGVAASSAPGMAAISMIAIVLEPFGLPVVVSIILLTAIHPIIDPILTAVNIYGNCASAALVARIAPVKSTRPCPEC